MLVSSCPLRISLVGGSTDHPEFLKKYKTGSVISFASDLKTYSAVHRDVIGHNSVFHKYIINYSKKECVNSIDEIQNVLIRHCFEVLNVKEINCYITSDIFSSGSGLASSSSYIMSIVKSILSMNGERPTDNEICKISMDIEKRFNPLVGQQDFYGGCIGGIKKITFFSYKEPIIEMLSDNIFKMFDMCIYHTNVDRASTNILQTINIDKSLELLDDVEAMYSAIISCDVNMFMNTIKNSWEKKKRTSENICSGKIYEIDKKLSSNPDILAHKLCGAGGGGYFLIFTKKGKINLLNLFDGCKKIKISKKGLQCKMI